MGLVSWPPLLPLEMKVEKLNTTVKERAGPWMQVHARHCGHECSSDTKEKCILLLRSLATPKAGIVQDVGGDIALQGRGSKGTRSSLEEL